MDVSPELGPVEQRLVEAYRRGMTLEEIAERSRCTPMLIRRVLGEAGVLPPRRGRRYPFDPHVEEAIAVAYAAGASMEQIRARHGGTNRVIRYVLDHRGITVRPRGGRR